MYYKYVFNVVFNCYSIMFNVPGPLKLFYLFAHQFNSIYNKMINNLALNVLTDFYHFIQFFFVSVFQLNAFVRTE